MTSPRYLQGSAAGGTDIQPPTDRAARIAFFRERMHERRGGGGGAAAAADRALDSYSRE